MMSDEKKAPSGGVSIEVGEKVSTGPSKEGTVKTKPSSKATVEAETPKSPSNEAKMGQSGGGAFIATGGGKARKVEGTSE